MPIQDESRIAAEIIAMERAALERWGRGDPSGFLEITDEEVSYIDPFLPHRLDSLAALTELYESIRGQVQMDSWEMTDPRVQVVGDAAVLTFRFVSRSAAEEHRWNCTEVYRRAQSGEWRIIHTHWSQPLTPVP